jgi:alpha-1,2-mannosyltransferase
VGATIFTGLIEALCSGDWLTRARVRRWGLAALIAGAGGLAYLVASAHGIVDFRNRPLGTDFAGFYAAGTLVAGGDVAAPYDVTRLHAGEQAIFGADAPLYSFSYPPFFLLIVAALARLPYALALALWQGVSLALYLLALRAVLRTGRAADANRDLEHDPEKKSHPALTRDRLWVLLALGFPGVFVNLAHGQNGLLTAALIGGALALLQSRPIVAGVLFGLLTYKPQYGPMIPLALIAGGYWRTVAAAIVTVALLVLATLVAFGPEAWRAFIASTEFMRTVLLESGAGGWHKMQSVFTWTRMWGGSVALAYAMQAIVMVALGATLIRRWRAAVPFELKAAALCLAIPLATPFSFDYDLVVLAPAIAFFAVHGAAHGFGRFTKTALAVLWIVPSFARMIAGATLIPLTVPAMLAAYALALRDSSRVGMPEPGAAKAISLG